MSSTLDACFDNTESSKLQPDSSEKPNNVAQDRVLFGAAESDEFSKTAPIVMQAFHIHGETCSRVEAEALQLALDGSKSSEEDEEARLQAYRDMLDELEALHAEALTLESSIEELTSAQNAEDHLDAETTEPSARSQILGVISASLPVIKARIMNLSMAQELVDSALENLTMSLRMESLGIE
ncbi:hypothetical protein DFP72DRAFT_595181 [Ephemerocybe angulata]|uniref:Uncharacterized protein n=1 Tax=Ephemerocybe angulata TaxID=980116 RepID=A0A8H6MBB1_9AGAR|nr:hypothetical protein DFP72DRAFT_595181 [Tulosesus angulatus]